MPLRTTSAVFAVVLLAPDSGAAQTRTLTPLDLASLARVSDPQVSPDGRRVAFVVSELDWR